MLREGTIPITAIENVKLRILRVQENVTSVTRRDPGNTGPLVVEAGKKRFLIHMNGRVQRVRWWNRG